MANRRMFSVRVINSAKFMKMPATSQNLYFHLGIRADDDGVVEAYSVMSMIGASEDDLRVLAGKEYVTVLNEDFVTYINDWKEHNSIRPDRKIDSMYKDLLVQIKPDVQLVEKRPRADLKKDMDVQWTDNGQPMGGIGKVRLGKDNINTYTPQDICPSKSDDRENDFEKIYEIYPVKKGRTKAYTNYCRWLTGKVVNGKRVKLTNRQMYIAVRNYVQQQEREEKPIEYYKNFDTLMGIQLLDHVEDDTHE